LRAALPIYVVFLVHHHLHDLFPEGGAVAAEAGDPGIGRLLQVAVWDGVYLPELDRVLRIQGRHAPRRRGIQYSEALSLNQRARRTGSSAFADDDRE
jgi:hypothetical protein